MSAETTTKKLEQVLAQIEKKNVKALRNMSTTFWINNSEQHASSSTKSKGNCCFNHQMGLPTSKIPPCKELPIFGYEVDIIEKIERYKDYALNKARGIGATELILRWMLFKAVHNKIPDRKFLIITGIRHELAQDYIRRLLGMCTKIREVVGRVSQNAIQVNMTEITAMPANAAAIRGYENVGIIFADEAAHWDLLDDDQVLEAIEPHRTKSDAHIIIVSTPNGRRGFFAKIFHNQETKYYTDYKPWNVAEGLLIDRVEVDKIKKEDYYRYEQEYNCQFLTTRYSAFPEEVLAVAQQNSEVYQLSD